MAHASRPPGSIPLERHDPIIKAAEVAWVIFDKPDLAKVQPFLEDFGLVASGSSPEGQFFRGAGPLPYVYLARPAEDPGFVGGGFLAASREDLDTLSATTGRPIEKLERPGGGEVVRLTDPNGYLVEVAYGVERVEPLPFREEILPVNTPFDKPRVNTGQRAPLEPALAWRLGHYVLQSNRFEETAEWYMRHLGLLPSDVQCLDDGRPALAFMRTDRGDAPSDHHAVALAMGLAPTFVHCAFEVIDVDAIGQGNQVMHAAGWNHFWGIGRHLLGSQLFDYWRDPDGHEMEHYSDGDVFDASVPTGYSPLTRGGIYAWGEDLPKSFGPQPGLGLLRDVLRELRAGRIDFATLRQLAGAMGQPARPWLR
ncbi:MAG: VOC family protein [bacterium]|nr:VOC family protein [bacterium]